MFCPTCGFENAQGVNYCKRCGANLNNAPAKTISPAIVAIFLAVVGFITVIGFTIPMVAMSELSHKGFDSERLMGIAVFFLIATFGIDFMLLRMLSRLLGFTRQGRPEPHPLLVKQPKYHTADQTVQRLPEPPISMPSVTEHTTRNFEPVTSREARTKETS
ncbi:MAG: zinc ribbon domain-containing protein [Acidobacteria bacterium]|nr:zinc ribbon domain-containing protein [Acidobacteriota bacterium]